MNIKWYTAYVEATGEIVATFSCDAADAPLNTPTDALLIEGEHYSATGYIKDGVFAAYTPEEASAKANRPGSKFLWSNLSMSWVDLRSLEEAKAAKWDQIKAKRNDAEWGGFAWDGSVFDSDPLSQSRIQGAVLLANLSPSSFSVDWTLKDNSVRVLSASQMVGVGEALGSHVAAQHTIGRQLRQEIENATTVEAVESVTWPV